MGILESKRGAPGRNRTCGRRFRRPLLFPLSYGGAESETAIYRLRH